MTDKNGNARRKGAEPGRRVIVLVVPPVEELDLVGPIQVFSAANRFANASAYRVEIATAGNDLKVQGESGLLSFVAQNHYSAITGDFDSLLLVCGIGTRNVRNAALFGWLRRVARSVRRLGSVCVGAFLLAEAGLLNGKRATSHWKFSKELAERYPRVKVEASEPVWAKDQNIYTSAGISAGVDLALAWVEEDCGNAIATEIAREFVLFLRRPAGQAQLSVSLTSQALVMKSIQELQVWIAENLHKNLSCQYLADRVAMSIRNFERVFAREVGTAPARYVRRVRIEAAQRMLEQSGKGLNQIAAACGFSSADLMRRLPRRARCHATRASANRYSNRSPVLISRQLPQLAGRLGLGFSAADSHDCPPYSSGTSSSSVSEVLTSRWSGSGAFSMASTTDASNDWPSSTNSSTLSASAKSERERPCVSPDWPPLSGPRPFLCDPGRTLNSRVRRPVARVRLTRLFALVRFGWRCFFEERFFAMPET